MSLWSSDLDALVNAWSYILDLLKAMPTLVGAGIAFLGVAFGQYLAHRFTQRREDEKILREKAEALINTLCQIQHSLFVLHDGLLRDAYFAPPEAGVLSNISLESNRRPAHTYGDSIRRLPEPREYRAVLHAIYLDTQRADTLQRLYFPSLLRYDDARVDALIPILGWLERHVIRQAENSPHWPEQFRAEDTEQWPRLNAPNGAAHEAIIGAVAREVLPHRSSLPLLSRLRRR